ncbi:MAG: peptide deformylase [Candidatus Liptonbacteria bacterium]
MEEKILQYENPAEEKVLRAKTKPFSFSPKGDPIMGSHVFSRGEFSKLILTMRKMMKRANGVGLSANQVGFSYRMFVAQVPNASGEQKFYTILNPELTKDGKGKVAQEEGCLSVVGIWGTVERPDRITLCGFDRNGKPVKIKAWGLLARVFQHEVDHLDGKLFIDRAKNLQKVDDFIQE